MNRQCTSNLLMIRPASFAYNEETAESNIYQQKPEQNLNIQHQALIEFDALAEKLSAAGVNVIVVSDTPEPHKPDAIFPNNWVSFHHDGTVVLYPMFAANRRAERRKDILEILEKKHYITIKDVIDLSRYEQEAKFLEGTGSVVFDHENKLAFTAISQRTEPGLVNKLCNKLGYTPVFFHTHLNGIPVYHTNVLLSVCSKFMVVCMDYIIAEKEKENISVIAEKTGKELIIITAEQAENFAGNVLEVRSVKGENILVMSTSAYNSFTSVQLKTIEKHCRIIHTPLDTIEKHGGGSARCMLAEVFTGIEGNKGIRK